MNTDQRKDVRSEGLSMEAATRILVVGGGIAAHVAAQTLGEMGADVTLARIRDTPSHAYPNLPGPGNGDEFSDISAGPADATVMDLDRAPALWREGGRFRAEWNGGVGALYDCVLLAPGLSLRPKPATLPEGVEVFTAAVEKSPAQRIAIVLDYQRFSDPSSGMAAFKFATENVVAGGASAVFFQHAPVMHIWGETLYDDARKAGVQFIRFADQLPVVACGDSDSSAGSFRVTVRDAIDPDGEFAFDCDRVFVVTGPDAGSIPSWAVKSLGTDRDGEGFLQSENVHAVPGASVLSGVFYLGEATGTLDPVTAVACGRAVAARAISWVRSARKTIADPPVTVGSSCVGCLTCHRVCPHGAITLKPEKAHPPVEAWGSLCQACGICAAVCPTLAISTTVFPDESLPSFLAEISPEERGRTNVVFGCRRSAGLLVPSVELPEGVRFVSVACAGRVSEHMIWSCLAAGVRGVLVVGCHHGNCTSHTGTDHAAARVRQGLNLGLFGQGPPRLEYRTIASNEAARFQKLLREFAAD